MTGRTDQDIGGSEGILNESAPAWCVEKTGHPPAYPRTDPTDGVLAWPTTGPHNALPSHPFSRPDQGPPDMSIPLKPAALLALEAPPRTRPSNYPEPFASRMAGRVKRPLGDLFGLAHFGVNLTSLRPGAVSALRHAHSRQDEFVYILAGHPTLLTDEGATPLAPGMCAGFAAGTGNGHQLVNETGEAVLYLEVGDRCEGDAVSYPEDDLVAMQVDGRWVYAHKDGRPYG